MITWLILIAIHGTQAQTIELTIGSKEISHIYQEQKSVDFRFSLRQESITETLGRLLASVRLTQEKENDLGYGSILHTLGQKTEQIIHQIFKTDTSKSNLNKILWTAKIASDIYKAVPQNLRKKLHHPKWADVPERPANTTHELQGITYKNIPQTRTGNEYKTIHIQTLTDSHTSAIKRVLGLINWVKSLTSGHNLLEKTMLYRMSNISPITLLNSNLRDIQNMISKGRLSEDFIKNNIQEIHYQMGMVTRKDNLITSDGFLRSAPIYLEKDASGIGNDTFLRLTLPFYKNSIRAEAFSWREKSFLIGHPTLNKAIEAKIRPLTTHIVSLSNNLFATNLKDHCQESISDSRQAIFACKSIPKTLRQATRCLTKLTRQDWKEALEFCKIDLKESISPNAIINNQRLQAFSSAGEISIDCNHGSITHKGTNYIETPLPNQATCTLRTQKESINITTNEKIDTHPRYKISLKGIANALKPQIVQLSKSLSKRHFVDPSLALSLIDIAYEAQDEHDNTFTLMITLVAIMLIFISGAIIKTCTRRHNEGRTFCPIPLKRNFKWTPVKQSQDKSAQQENTYMQTVTTDSAV